MEASEASLERQIKVRKVTHFQPTWVEQERGEPGTYTIQLILDEGADEYILSLDPDDADNLYDMLRDAKDVYFDLERKVLMFGTRPVGG